MNPCPRCQLKLEPDYEFCPRCGQAFGNPILAPSIDGCVHVRHGALPICVKCGNSVFDDETDIRKGDNFQWGIGAAVSAVIMFVMFFLANPSRVPKDTNDTAMYAQMARVELMIAILALGGVVFCLFRMRIFGERDV